MQTNPSTPKTSIPPPPARPPVIGDDPSRARYSGACTPHSGRPCLGGHGSGTRSPESADRLYPPKSGTGTRAVSRARRVGTPWHRSFHRCCRRRLPCGNRRRSSYRTAADHRRPPTAPFPQEATSQSTASASQSQASREVTEPRHTRLDRRHPWVPGDTDVFGRRGKGRTPRSRFWMEPSRPAGHTALGTGHTLGQWHVTVTKPSL